MKGLILAAGYGTRLYPLTIDKPKPLLDVGGKTIMERLLRKLEDVPSCDGVYIVTNERFFEVTTNWLSAHEFRFPVEIINDHTKSNDDRLGAIGDIELVIKETSLEDDVLVMAGDNLFEFNILDFISFGETKSSLCIALFDINNLELASQYGIVKLDSGSKVELFQEKPEKPESTLASTGIYYFPGKAVGYVAGYMETGNSKDAPGNLIKWVSDNYGVYGYVFKQGWYDIGDKVSLKQADEEYRRKGI